MKILLCLSFFQHFLGAHRTANAAIVAADQYSELTVANAVTLPGTPQDGWYLLTPYGDFPGPEGDRVQVFHKEQARDVVSTFNSTAGKAARYFKNMWHGLGAKSSVPIFEGHSDQNPKVWPTMNQVGEIRDLSAEDDGLWSYVTWNASGLARRTQEFGALKPSPLYWHEPKDAQGRVFPALLESVGLVASPNIRTAPTWTANALAGNPQAENQNQSMTTEQIMALRKALGLPESADFSAILTGATTANAAVATLAERDSALSTANSAKAALDTQLATVRGELSTANASLATMTTERDGLRTERDQLSTANAALVLGVLDLAEGKGAITPAEREEFKGKLSTANAATTLAELKTRKAMNTKPVELNGARVDLSTANARASTLETAIAKRIDSDKCTRDEAFARVKADPNYAPLFAAMADPTRKDS